MRKYFPGFDNAYLMYLSPYIGTRGGRAIEAEYIVTKQDLIDGRRHADVIHQTYDLRDAHNFADIPYRQLLPQKVEGLLAAGVAARGPGPLCGVAGGVAGVWRGVWQWVIIMAGPVVSPVAQTNETLPFVADM